MIVILFLLGLVVGSFLNVVICRIPRDQGIVLGRSRCPSCEHTLAWYDLIPVVSYLMLGGRCRYCGRHISLQYPLVELVSAVFFVFAPSIAWLVALEIFLVLAVIDLQQLLIPDGLLIILAVLAIVMRIASHPVNLLSAVAGGGFFLMLWLVSRGKWIGFGDVKLGAVLGLLFGFPGTAVVIYGGIILGGLIGIVLLLSGKANRKTAVPLGTFLAVAAMAYIFFQPTILTFLSNHLV